MSDLPNPPTKKFPPVEPHMLGVLNRFLHRPISNKLLDELSLALSKLLGVSSVVVSHSGGAVLAEIEHVSGKYLGKLTNSASVSKSA